MKCTCSATNALRAALENRGPQHCAIHKAAELEAQQAAATRTAELADAARLLDVVERFESRAQQHAIAQAAAEAAAARQAHVASIGDPLERELAYRMDPTLQAPKSATDRFRDILAGRAGTANPDNNDGPTAA